MDLPQQLVKLPDCQENWEILGAGLPPKWPKVPFAMMYNAADTAAFNNAATTVVPWNSIDEDSGVIGIQAASPKLTCRFAGLYIVQACTTWTGGANNRIFSLKLNGTTTIAASNISAVAFACNQNVNACLRMKVGDYVEAYGYQDSGPTLTMIGRTNGQPSFFSMIYQGA